MNKGPSGINEKRISEVYSLICQGARHSDIIEYCSKNFGVKKRRAEYYITEARKKIKEMTKNNIEELRAEANARYEELYRLCVLAKDYKTASYVLSRLDRVNALETFNFKTEITMPEKLQQFFLDKIND